jgi:hypothetical protein
MSGALPPEIERAVCAALERVLEAKHPEFAFHVGPPEEAPGRPAESHGPKEPRLSKNRAAEEAPERPDLLEAIARLEGE